MWLLLVAPLSAIAQPNCEVYRMKGDTACYEACKIAVDSEAGQGYRQSQKDFDRALALCPTLAFAHREKSVPYLKRGQFVQWYRLLEPAVKLEPTTYLSIRAWCRYQFLRDYRGALRDIDKLDSLVDYDLGYSGNGDYHLNLIRAICYKQLGMTQRAIAIMEQQMSTADYSPLKYDYVHLGKAYLEAGDRAKAKTAFEKSIQLSDYLAEPYYYLAIIDMDGNNRIQAKSLLEKAKSHYQKGYRMFDPYTHPVDKIFMRDIEVALVKAN
jgi:tetratricopeptide (TPR) repeat protein